MHSIRFYHWFVVLLIAVMIHAGIIWAYPSDKEQGVVEAIEDIGVVAFEIGLAVETVKQNMAPPEPKPKPVERKPVEPKVVEKKTLPPPKPEIESDVALAPVEEVMPPVIEAQEVSLEPDEALVQHVTTEPLVTLADDSPQEERDSAIAGGDEGLEEAYQTELSAWLEKHKSYPRRARQRQQEGTVFLRFRIDHSGNLISHEIDKSSGFRLLDHEVEKMLKRALPLPEIPVALGVQEIELILPVSFRLN